MPVQTREIKLSTRGQTHVVDLTREVSRCLTETGLERGIVTVFVVGSTAGITTTEFEPGLVNRDLSVAFEKIAPVDGTYLHEQTWNDDNGHAHVRASLVGPSVTVPFANATLILGGWQQIVLIDFDTRPRDRRIIVQIIGE